jgi:hypothetical protein
MSFGDLLRGDVMNFEVLATGISFAVSQSSSRT